MAATCKACGSGNITVKDYGIDVETGDRDVVITCGDCSCSFP